MTATKKKKKTKTWRQARRLKLYRKNIWGDEELLDPGVNFFVLMLEALGARTEFSCEGHPDGFYIVFYAPISLAQSLVYCGFFRVELEGRTGGHGDIYRWSLRSSHMHNEKEKEKVLNWAAESWARFFNNVTI